MAPASTSAYWTAPEELALIDFLVAHKAEAGDGANFKAPTFQKAAKHLAPLYKCGAPKNAKSCGNKFCAFRKTYRVIRAIQSVSGWTWDDETGATIDIYTASSWDDYVKVHPEAKPFQNQGWPLFRKMETLMPATIAGANVYHAASAPPPPPASLPPATFSINSDDEEAAEAPSQQSDASSDVEVIPPPSTSGNKRQREPATPTKHTTKRAHASNGANALLSIAESLGAFNTTFAGALAPPSTGVEATPIRRTKAITTVLQLEKDWLTTTQCVHLVDFLKRDQSAADVYLALTSKADVHKEWVRIQLDNLGITIPTY